MSNSEYVTADSFFKDSTRTTIPQDVRLRIKQRTTNPVPYSETPAGRQSAQWSGLSQKIVGAE